MYYDIRAWLQSCQGSQLHGGAVVGLGVVPIVQSITSGQSQTGPRGYCTAIGGYR
jgi:hypothetical protein